MKNSLFLFALLFLFGMMQQMQAQECACPEGTIPGVDLVTNGDFSAGGTGFSTGLAEQVSCDPSTFIIGQVPMDKCPAWSDNLFDHTTGDNTGSYMIIDGHATGATGGLVWSQNVNLQNGQHYTFSFYWRPKLNFIANTSLSLLVGNTNISGTIAPINTTDWVEVCFEYEAQSDGNANIQIRQVSNFGALAHDYGIDDISFVACELDTPNCVCPAGTTPGSNLVSNGDFTNLYADFDSDLFYIEQCDPNIYIVGHTGSDKCESWPEAQWDHTTGTPSGLYLIIDGFNNTPASGQNRIWFQTVQVEAGQEYQFKFYWRPGLEDNFNTKLALIVDNISIGFIDPIPTTNWVPVCYSYTATADASVEISIRQIHNFGLDGHDYGIDDISFVACESNNPPCEVNAEWSVDQNSCAFDFFDESIVDASTKVVGHFYDFGDGNTSSESNPSHVFQGPGTYEVCLTTYAVNDFGECCRDTYCAQVENTCPEAECSAGITDIARKKRGECTYQFLPVLAANRPVIGYLWNFGDGNTSTADQPSHTYESTGVYQVCLTVILQDGVNCCSQTYCEFFWVQCGDPNGSTEDFNPKLNDIQTASTLLPCAINAEWTAELDPTTCAFNFFDESIGSGSTAILGYLYDFGDGSTSTEANPIHYYQDPGNYLVCLTTYAANDKGECCSDTYCTQVETTCEINACTIEVTDISRKQLAKFECNYEFTSVFTANRPVIGYLWDFGDGNSSTDPNPKHYFEETGSYTICVTVILKDELNCCSQTYCEQMWMQCGDPDGAAEDSESKRIDVQQIQERTTGSLLIFPNPAKDQVHLQFQAPIHEHYELNLFNIHGQLIFNQPGTTEARTSKVELNSTPLLPGTYFIKLQVNGEILNEKLIIQ